MDTRQQIRFMAESKDWDLLAKVPKWARAEHMEMNTPPKELWEYSDFGVENHSILKRFIRKLKGLRKMKR